MNKKLYKVEEGKMLCGVCTGIAKYLDFDVTIIRLLWALITFFGGAGIVAYIVCAIIMPDEPYFKNSDIEYPDFKDEN